MGNYVRAGLFDYPLPYLELLPEYTCVRSGEESSPYSCEPKDFCDDPDVTAAIDWEAKTSLHNWVEKLDLACKSKQAVGFIGSAYFIGVMISMLTLPRLSDLYGRKWIILLCSIAQFLVVFWLLAMSTLGECYACFIIYGLGFGGTISINTLYTQEFLQKKHRALTITVAQMIKGTIVALLVLYFLFITKNW